MDTYEEEFGKSWDFTYLGAAPKSIRPGPIVDFVMSHVKDDRPLLYIGFGSGANAIPLMDSGLNIWATEVSQMAVARGHSEFPRHQERLTLGGVLDAYPGMMFAGAIVSRVLMEESLFAAAERIGSVASRIAPGGEIFLQAPALGTDLWPDWMTTEMDSYGNLIAKYDRDIPAKVYYSSAGVIGMCQKSGLEVVQGPQPHSVPRNSFPGGYIRYWTAKGILSRGSALHGPKEV